MLLNDREIRRLSDPKGWYLRHDDAPAGSSHPPMIEPFSEAVSGDGIISYGLTSAGYDLRLAEDFMVFKNTRGEAIDPKKFKHQDYRDKVLDSFTAAGVLFLPPHSYVLGRSVEYLRIPRHLKGRCTGKSTLARCGVLVNTTPLEPGWEGHLTIEIGNVTPCQAMLWVGEGVAQLEFETLVAEPEVSYADKGGVYQGQRGVTPARVR